MDTITAAEHEALEWAYGDSPPAFAKNGYGYFSVIVPEFGTLAVRTPGQEIPKSCLPRKAHFEAVRYQFDGQKPFTRWRCINPISDPFRQRQRQLGYLDEGYDGYEPLGYDAICDRLKKTLRPDKWERLQQAKWQAGQRRNR